MHIWQIILISLLAFFKKIDHKGPQIAIYNSMLWGGLAGLVMGDFKTGLMIGGTFQLMSLGVTSIGGSSVPDYQIGAIISTAIAVSTGQGAAAGITIGLPVAMACIQLDVLQNLLDGWLVRKAQRYCESGEFKKMNAMIWLCIPGTGLSTAIPAFIAAAFGPAVVETLMGYLPAWFLPGLSIAGKILPVCGIAALILYMPVKRYFEYLLFGFVLSAYLNVPLLGTVIVGVGFAHMVYKKRMREEMSREKIQNNGKRAEAEEQSYNQEVAASAVPFLISPAAKLTKKDLRRAGWRCSQSLISFNYENQMAGGLVYAMAPALRKIYTDDREYKEALGNHFQFFNVTPYLENIIIGIALSMEEHDGIRAREAVQSMKVGLMGAITGFGDSIFYVLLPTIFGSVGGYMAIAGNPAGMLVWLACGLLFFVMRPLMVETAYKGGQKLMDAFESRLSVFTDAAAALGLTVVGSMLTTVVSIKTPLTFRSGEVVREIQSVLDGILPSMLPVIAAAAVLILIKKKVKLTWIILLIIAVSCLCAAFGILV